MSLIYNSRPRLFGPRKKTGLIRRGLMCLGLIGVVGFAGWLAHTTQPVTVETKIDSVITASADPTEDLSLRDAFSIAPTPRSAHYSEDMSATVKPQTVTIPRDVMVARQMATLQETITDMLTADPSAEDDKKSLKIGKGDTLMGLLVEAKVPQNQAHEAIVALRKYYDPRDLNPSQSITLFFHRDPALADPEFKGLEIVKDKINTVSVNRSADGGFTAEQAQKEVVTRMRAFEGKIDSSLYVSAKAAGIPDGVIMDLIKMYSYQVDFQRDFQSGDGFKVLFQESVTDTGDVIHGRSQVKYAELNLSGRAMSLYWHEDANGNSGFFDENGKSVKKALMRTPIDGARISSGFGMRRHPILGYSKMHKGVDFAAPTGTPIYAAGDGKIAKIGTVNGYGKYIKIQHAGNMATAYAHMSRFKSGLKNGARVKQGDVIGYVGTTGRSTGPHLHYEVIMAGKQVNPASVKTQPGNALAGKALQTFKANIARMHNDFQRFKNDTTLAAGDNAALNTASN